MIEFLVEVLFKLIFLYGIVKTVTWLSEADNRERFADSVGVFLDAANSDGSSSGGESCGGSDSGGSCGGGDSGGGGGGD